MESTPEQLRFQEALRANGFSLSGFRVSPPANLFPNNSLPLPEFFEQNLVSPHRILKHFRNDVHANIKILYYQLLRVTYEVETEVGFNTSFMYNLIHIVFHEEFELLFASETEGQRDLYNDFQFKKLFAEFIVLLQNEEQPNVEALLNTYPIMDSVFVHIYRSILASQGIDYSYQTKIPTAVVFGEIGHLLGLNIESYNSNCWKFADSDMFCYEDNENSIYLAYIHEANISSEDPSSGGAHSYESYNTTGTKIDGLGLYGSGAGSIGSNDYSRPAVTVTSTGGYQSLDQMANRYVNVEPRHDVYEMSSLAAPSNRNEVKESMISVTYDFVDFTGQTEKYKDKVPRREAQKHQQASGLAQASSSTEYKPADSRGLGAYITNQASSYESPSFSSSNVNQTSYNGPLTNYLSDPAKNVSSYESSFKQSNYNEYSSTSSAKYELPKFEVPSFPATGLSSAGGYANTFSESLYSPIYKPPEELPSFTKPSTGLDTYSYGATTKVENKPLSQSYATGSYRSESVVEPLSVSRQDQKFGAASATAFESTGISASITLPSYGGGDLGDYYNDFTADNLLNAVVEPYRTKVLQIKSRVRGWKKSGIFSNNAITVGRV